MEMMTSPDLLVNIDSGNACLNQSAVRMFNNNYIPGIGPFSSKSRQPEITTPTSTNLPKFSGFTFAVPTQASIITRNATQSYFDSNCRLHTSAPGVGANWQHTMPSQNTWTDSVSWSNPMGISTCTARPLSSSYVNSSEPRPSCSVLRKRPKRHSTDNMEQSTPTTKMFLTEEKMAAQMKELQINNIEQNAVPFSSFRVPNLITRMTEEEEHFRLLEESLSVEDTDTWTDKEDTKEPKLHFLNKIDADSFIAPALPEKILEQLKKPPLEVVLWKPPGDFVKDFLLPVMSEKSAKSVSVTNNTNTVLATNNNRESKTQTSGGLAEAFCKSDDLMDSELVADLDDPDDLMDL